MINHAHLVLFIHICTFDYITIQWTREFHPKPRTHITYHDLHCLWYKTSTVPSEILWKSMLTPAMEGGTGVNYVRLSHFDLVKLCTRVSIQVILYVLVFQGHQKIPPTIIF